MMQNITLRMDDFKFNSGLMVAMVLVWHGEVKYRSMFQIQLSLEAVTKQEQLLCCPQRYICVSLTDGMNVMMICQGSSGLMQETLILLI